MMHQSEFHAASVQCSVTTCSKRKSLIAEPRHVIMIAEFCVEMSRLGMQSVHTCCSIVCEGHEGNNCKAPGCMHVLS